MQTQPMPGEGIPFDLGFLGSVSINAQTSMPDLDVISSNTVESKPIFTIAGWHRPYAQALIEADRATLPMRIAAAECAILSRHAELNDYSIQTDEGLDLRHAIQALHQLKTAHRIH